MNDISFHVVDTFPEPAFSKLASEAFSDYEPSPLLTDVLNAEASARSGHPNAANDEALRIGAFRDETLIAWTYARREGTHHLHMINSGVAPAERRTGVYTMLVRLIIEHASSLGYTAILSRHAASNNAVIIAKLKLGFFVSGFEYSEVYGPLVRLTFLPGEFRRTLYRSRSSPIRRVDPQ